MKEREIKIKMKWKMTIKKQRFIARHLLLERGALGRTQHSTKKGAFSIIHNSRVLRVAAAAALSEWRHSAEPYTKIEERVSASAIRQQVSAVNHIPELNTPTEKT